MSSDIRQPKSHPTEYKHRDGCYLAPTHLGPCKVPMSVWTEEKYFGQTVDPIVDQPDPVPSNHPSVWDLVIKDMATRSWVGVKRYGTSLQPFNGRDPLVDAYQEVLDLAVYLRQEIYERSGK